MPPRHHDGVGQSFLTSDRVNIRQRREIHFDGDVVAIASELMRPETRALWAVGRHKCVYILSSSQTLLSIEPFAVLVACGQPEHQQGSLIGDLEICEHLIAVIAQDARPKHVSLH